MTFYRADTAAKRTVFHKANDAPFIEILTYKLYVDIYRYAYCVKSHFM